jgi:hypothetical protein
VIAMIVSAWDTCDHRKRFPRPAGDSIADIHGRSSSTWQAGSRPYCDEEYLAIAYRRHLAHGPSAVSARVETVLGSPRTRPG